MEPIQKTRLYKFIWLAYSQPLKPMSGVAATVPYHCTMLCNSVRLFTTLYNSVRLCTTLYNSVQLCTTLYNSVRLWCTFEIRPFIGETLEAGTCLSISISRKEIKMRRHTHFLVMSEKFWGTQPPTKESILSSRHLLLQKLILLKRWEIFPDLRQWCH